MAIPPFPQKDEEGFSASLADFIRFFVARLEPLQVERAADVETMVEHRMEGGRYMLRARVSFAREAVEGLVLQVLRGMGLPPEFQLQIGVDEWMRIEQEFTEWQRAHLGGRFAKEEAYRRQIEDMARSHRMWGQAQWPDPFTDVGVQAAQPFATCVPLPLKPRGS